VYIGQDLQVAFSSYLNIDDISGSFNSVTTSFALTVNGSTPVPLPINSQQCLISVGGIIQRPDDTGTEGFRLSGSNIVFSSAPNTGEDFFGTILAGADYINAGVNFPDGQSSAPSITFDQDLDTGFFRSSSGAVSFSSNGVNTATLGSNSFTAPSFIPTSSSVPSNGVFLPAANSVAIATNGTQQATVDSSGRLLVGTSTNQIIGVGSGGAQFQSVGSNPFAVARFSNDTFGCVLAIGKSRGSSPGSFTTVQNNDILGELRFAGSDGTDLSTVGAQINAEVDGTPGANDLPTRLIFATTADGASSATERMRISQNGFVSFAGDTDTGLSIPTTNEIALTTGGTECVRFENKNVKAGTTFSASTFTDSSTEVGAILSGQYGGVFCNRSSGASAFFNRLTDDGEIVRINQAGINEGNISVSGTTVSYNGAHLSRWSQLPSGAERTEILRGSVLSNLDEMCEWGDEENEQLNRMKVSDVEGDKNVSGVFQCWDDDDDTYTNDFYCAMTGDFIIRIAEGVTVERGDLLMSAGDGTAKPQDDDIIRSKTIAKVTSTNVSCTYEDGSYCVPCVLMAC
jgi:hypothetical protein